jgi:predicted RNA binding protein with dsRBD fold (UPF0201 family)
MSVNVSAESLVNPTEDQSKVERALRNIFPSGTIKTTNLGEDVIKLEVAGTGLDFLKTLRNLIKQERIRSAARRILMNETHGSQLRFYLNKQAAFVGRVSFCEPVAESPLGPIAVRIQAADPIFVIDFLASKPNSTYR